MRYRCALFGALLFAGTFALGGSPARAADTIARPLSVLAGSDVAGPATSIGQGIGAIAVSGNFVYSAEGAFSLRQLDLTTGLQRQIVDVAGAPGWIGTMGPMAADGRGGVYVGECPGIVDVHTDGTVTPMAGAGSDFWHPVPASDPATAVCPDHLAAAPDGSVVAADAGQHQLYRLGSAGKAVIAPIGPGGLSAAGPVAVGADGTIYVGGADGVTAVAPSGSISTVVAPGFTTSPLTPGSLAVDPAGDLYMGVSGAVLKRDPAGTITTVAGQPSGPGPLADWTMTAGEEGGPATNAHFIPVGIGLDPAGDLVLGDAGNERIRVVDHATGAIRTIAGNGMGSSGDGGPAASASVHPHSVATDAAGNTYVLDGVSIRRIDLAGVITRVVGSGTAPTKYVDGWPDTSPIDSIPASALPMQRVVAMTVDATGDIYVALVQPQQIAKIDLAGVVHAVGGPIPVPAYMTGGGGGACSGITGWIGGIAVDHAGNVIFSDSSNQRIRRVDPAGNVTTIAGTGVGGFAGDGGPATAAQISNPLGVTVAANGDIVVADSCNSKLRAIHPNGTITTLLATEVDRTVDGKFVELAQPQTIAADRVGDVFVVGWWQVYKIDAGGLVSAVAGGGTIDSPFPGADATTLRTAGVSGLAVQPASGALTLADTLHERIWNVAGVALPDDIARLAGGDRVLTSIAVAHATYQPQTARSAVIASGDDYPDALAGAPLAAANSGPLLLTDHNFLDPAVAQELKRDVPAGATVYLLGGPSALSSYVDGDVAAFNYHVVRISGADRYATAAAIATQGLGSPHTAFLATGTDFPDALAAAAIAGPQHAAILLTNGSQMTPATTAYLAAHPPMTLYAVGGPAAAAAPTATAIVGTTRYATAALLATKFAPTPTIVGVASGTNYPDALSAGPALATTSSPLLLTDPTILSPELAAYLTKVRTPTLKLELIGGTNALSNTVLNQAHTLITTPT